MKQSYPILTLIVVLYMAGMVATGLFEIYIMKRKKNTQRVNISWVGLVFCIIRYSQGKD